MYIVLDGECLKEVIPSSFHDEEAGVETIGHARYFNMFAMWYNCPCGATITTIGNVTTLSISYDELNHICTRETRVLKEAMSTIRKDKVEIDKCLKLEGETMTSIRHAMGMHLFKLLFLNLHMENIAYNATALALVCEQSKEVTLKMWEPIFTKGELYDTVYILETGGISEHESDIETLRDEDELGDVGKCIHHTAPGTCFGTLCLQGKDQNVPTSTAAASQDTLMLSIPGDVLRRMLRNGSLT